MKKKISFYSLLFFLIILLANNGIAQNNDQGEESVDEYENVLIKEFPIALQCWTYRKKVR